MLKQIIIAIQAYWQAHKFINKHKLWKWIILPGIIYMALFIGGIFLFIYTVSQFINYVLLHTGIKVWLDSFTNAGLVSFVFLIIQIGVQIVLFYFYFSLFKYLFLIVGSPVFAYLSEKTEAIIEGKKYPFSFKQLVKDMMRGITLALRNTLWQTVYSICILLLAFIPIVGLATVVLAFFVECYYLGFAMLDYSSERHKLTISQSVDFIGHHKGLAIGNGTVFYLMHLVPILGWVLAPGYAVIAATISLYGDKE